jgi:hypothetical protein
MHIKHFKWKYLCLDCTCFHLKGVANIIRPLNWSNRRTWWNRLRLQTQGSTPLESLCRQEFQRNETTDGAIKLTSQYRHSARRNLLCAIRERTRSVFYSTRTSLRRIEREWTCCNFRRYWQVILETCFLLPWIAFFLLQTSWTWFRAGQF